MSSPNEILGILSEMRAEAKSLESLIAQIAWYMRGSIGWNEAWNLSERQRKTVIKLIESNIERTKKAQMPLL